VVGSSVGAVVGSSVVASVVPVVPSVPSVGFSVLPVEAAVLLVAAWLELLGSVAWLLLQAHRLSSMTSAKSNAEILFIFFPFLSI